MLPDQGRDVKGQDSKVLARDVLTLDGSAVKAQCNWL